jgi:hypothetical protein
MRIKNNTDKVSILSLPGRKIRVLPTVTTALTEEQERAVAAHRPAARLLARKVAQRLWVVTDALVTDEGAGLAAELIDEPADVVAEEMSTAHAVPTKKPKKK